ncbi:5-oxoprolinase subunit PxpB [Georgenia deserti]|uniref:5-oxoprolinase subunit PxpB n=1 Tax=Georgenia deserti TaxID=2093781 RepID=A0ABW4L3X8_9MICO
MRALRAGTDAVLVDVADLETALALTSSLRDQLPDGVVEVIPAARTVLLRFDPTVTTARRLADEVRSRPRGRDAPPPASEPLEIPVVYDGADLTEVAQWCGLSPADVVARHTQAVYTVAFTGFAPGFAYLSGGDPVLRVPRRASPRTSIPAGSVAIAGEFSGVYPRSSPGGWRLLGRTDVDLFDVDRDPPALLQPGGRVRFVAVEELPGRRVIATGLGPASRWRTADRQASGDVPGPGLEVTAVAGQALLQDLGRDGVARLGLASSGAMDRGALRRANRRVGNPPQAAAIEVALGGLTLRARGDLVVAVAGARVPLTVEGRQVPSDRAVAVDDGEEIRLGPPETGVYTYLALRGGFDLSPVLGSAARDVLAAVGPEPLAAGDVLAAGGRRADAVPLPEPEPVLPGTHETTTVDVVLGPRADWFSSGALAVLTGQTWTVLPESNRIGRRLTGERALTRVAEGELASEPTGRGALQVPPEGRPVLLAADHPVTGGYPVIAHVAAHDLDLAMQVPPGASIRFRAVDLAQDAEAEEER